jgi:hypothetical protein
MKKGNILEKKEDGRKSIWKNKMFALDGKEFFRALQDEQNGEKVNSSGDGGGGVNGRGLDKKYDVTKSPLRDFLPQDVNHAKLRRIKKKESSQSPENGELYVDMLDHEQNYAANLAENPEYDNVYQNNNDTLFEPLVNMDEGDNDGKGNDGSEKILWNMPYYTLDDYIEDVSYNKNESNLIGRESERKAQEQQQDEKGETVKSGSNKEDENSVLEKTIKQMMPTKRVNDNFNKMVKDFNYRTFREFVRALVNYIPESVDYYAYYVSYQFANLYYKKEESVSTMYYERTKYTEKLEKYVAKTASNGKKTENELNADYEKKRKRETEKMRAFLEKTEDLDKDANILKGHLYSVLSIPFALYIAYNWWFLFQRDDSYIDFTKILERVKPLHFFLESTIQPMNYLNYFLLGSKNEDYMKKILGALESLFFMKGLLMFALFGICYFIVITYSSYFNTTLNDIIDTKKNTLYSVSFAVVVLYYLSNDVFNMSNLKDIASILKNPVFICAGLLIKFLFVMIFVPLSLPFVFLYLIVFSFFGIIMNKGIGDFWSTLKILNYEIANSAKSQKDEECAQIGMLEKILHFVNKHVFKFMIPIMAIGVSIKAFIDSTDIVSQSIQLMMFILFSLFIIGSVAYSFFMI